MTKRQLIDQISSNLKESRRTIIIDRNPQLREPNRGLQSYCVAYSEKHQQVMVFPWYEAERCWQINPQRVKKSTLNLLNYLSSDDNTYWRTH